MIKNLKINNRLKELKKESWDNHYEYLKESMDKVQKILDSQ